MACLFSKKAIPDYVSNVLSLGNKFGLTVNYKGSDRLSITLDTIKNFEVRSYKIHPNEVNHVRSLISNSLLAFLNKNSQIDFIDRHILKEFKKCNRFLNENDDVIVKADKSQIIVIIDKEDYSEKMTELVNDQSTYKKLKKDLIT